ncbi:MAG: hypothetical protein ABII96_11730 [Candidatus Zixiibacteriota bacterium]
MRAAGSAVAVVLASSYLFQKPRQLTRAPRPQNGAAADRWSHLAALILSLPASIYIPMLPCHPYS